MLMEEGTFVAEICANCGEYRFHHKQQWRLQSARRRTDCSKCAAQLSTYWFPPGCPARLLIRILKAG